MKDYFGIYWTYPVRWVGLTRFEDVEHAATVSRTIRYQREQVLRHAAAQKRAVLVEEAFLEAAPDRGTIEVADEIAAAVRKRPDLTPVLVDFSNPLGWRRHHELRERMVSAGAEFLPAEPVFLDGRQFDPVEHFRNWAKQWADHAGSKEEHRAAIIAALKDTPLTGRAAYLNRLGLLTHTGKEWTADNLRKFFER
ncbi:hypothetical protein CP157_03881 (plasmid) [Paracoccus marcusii]|uniref:hypothetical protein n=1 Tax=Paracoccus marcusii TaxID=59779 RepID=UPI001C3C578C|nr:hypothetical protein [Paracoccus marcusii]QXI66089.1 hypothetical protein CP157_03881 [Paracoccus marcusii]